eukprot:224832-Chlamydomonas_euryale.AAC.6
MRARCRPRGSACPARATHNSGPKGGGVRQGEVSIADAWTANLAKAQARNIQSHSGRSHNSLPRSTPALQRSIPKLSEPNSANFQSDLRCPLARALGGGGAGDERQAHEWPHLDGDDSLPVHVVEAQPQHHALRL